MPFITEEIWHRVPKEDSLGQHPIDETKPQSLIVARYPEVTDGRPDSEAEAAMAVLQEFVVSVRTIRSEHGLPRAQEIECHFHADDAKRAFVLEGEKHLIEALTVSTLHHATVEKLDDPHQHFKNAAMFVNPGLRAVVPNVIDPERERERLEREIMKIDKDLLIMEKKLGNAGFVDRAPPAVVEKARADVARFQEEKAQLKSALSSLGA
jgi:valyl-tRNA synthetase